MLVIWAMSERIFLGGCSLSYDDIEDHDVNYNDPGGGVQDTASAGAN